MKRILSALTAVTLAAGLSLAAVIAPASAADTPDSTPAPAATSSSTPTTAPAAATTPTTPVTTATTAPTPPDTTSTPAPTPEVAPTSPPAPPTTDSTGTVPAPTATPAPIPAAVVVPLLATTSTLSFNSVSTVTYDTLLWKMDHYADSTSGVWKTISGAPAPQTLVTDSGTETSAGNSTLHQFDGSDLLTCGSAYQVDNYFTGADTTYLLEHGLLYGPNSPTEDLISGGWEVAYHVFQTPACGVPTAVTAPPTCTAGASLTLPTIPADWKWALTSGDAGITDGTRPNSGDVETPGAGVTWTFTAHELATSDVVYTANSVTFTVTGTAPATCTAITTTPTATPITECNVTGSVTITPAVGIDYWIDGTQVTAGLTLVDATLVAGTTPGTEVKTGLQGWVNIQAVAETGYTFADHTKTHWKFCLGDLVTCVPGDPSATPQTCDNNVLSADGTITVDELAGLSYLITGPGGPYGPFTGTGGQTVVATGLVAGDYVVTVTAILGYTLDPSLTGPNSSWPFKITLTAVACDFGATATAADCPSVPANNTSGTFTATTTGVPTITVGPLNPNVIYTAYLQGTATSLVLSATTTDLPSGGTWVVKLTLATPHDPEYTLPVGGVTLGTFDLTDFCPPPLATWDAGVSNSNAVCTNGTTTDGVITLVHSTGQEGEITYTITNTATNTVIYNSSATNTVNVPAGSYSVVATPPVGDGISGNLQNNPGGTEIFPTLTVDLTSSNCDTTRLAFTGGTIAWFGFVLAGGMLFLGIAFLLIRRRQNRIAD
jgi:hypothetical protein